MHHDSIRIGKDPKREVTEDMELALALDHLMLLFLYICLQANKQTTPLTKTPSKMKIKRPIIETYLPTATHYRERSYKHSIYSRHPGVIR